MNIYREWAMPNKNTFQIKPIKELIKKYMVAGMWLDPFANEPSLVHNHQVIYITNDLNPDYNTFYHLDALDFLKKFEDNSINGVLFDPPYSVRQVAECYKSIGIKITSNITRSDFYTKIKSEIARIIIPDGFVISFGWNSVGIGKTLGFEIIEILLVSHGGCHNDTICTVETKN